MFLAHNAGMCRLNLRTSKRDPWFLSLSLSSVASFRQRSCMALRRQVIMLPLFVTTLNKYKLSIMLSQCVVFVFLHLSNNAASPLSGDVDSSLWQPLLLAHLQDYNAYIVFPISTQNNSCLACCLSWWSRCEWTCRSGRHQAGVVCLCNSFNVKHKTKHHKVERWTWIQQVQSESFLPAFKWVYSNGNRPTELFLYVHWGLIIMPGCQGFHRERRHSEGIYLLGSCVYMNVWYNECERESWQLLSIKSRKWCCSYIQFFFQDWHSF